MNSLPIDWTDQLQTVYPSRSGPCGWRSTKLLFALRRALQESTWDELIDGVKRYAQYAKASGKEGSEFIIAPARFFEDGIYSETLEYQAPIDQKAAQAQAKEAARWDQALLQGSRLDLRPYQHESVAAFETRISIARAAPRFRSPDSVGVHDKDDALGTRIASLTERLRMAK